MGLAYYVPAVVLLICAVLYIFEDRSPRKWIFNIVIIALHIFVIRYFLVIETSMEVVLLFLMASLALSISVRPSKR